MAAQAARRSRPRVDNNIPRAKRNFCGSPQSEGKRKRVRFNTEYVTIIDRELEPGAVLKRVKRLKSSETKVRPTHGLQTHAFGMLY